MKHLSYSALIEVVGLRDLAEEEPDLFTNVSSEYRNVVSKMFQPKDGFAKREWIDSCFIECSSPEKLLVGLVEVRNRLLGRTRPILIRGAAVAEACFNERKTEFTQGAAKLEGRVSRLKACAFDIDDFLIEQLKQADEPKSFINFCLTHQRQGGHVAIRDLALVPQQAFEGAIKLLTVLHQVIDGAERAPKASRFFVPLLVNIVKNYSEAAVLNMLQALDDDADSYNFLKKKIPESEFIFLAAFDRFLRLSRTGAEPEKHRAVPVPEPVKSWAEAARGWIHQRATVDHEHGPVPAQIFSPEARGLWRRMIREKKAQDRDTGTKPSKGKARKEQLESEDENP